MLVSPSWSAAARPRPGRRLSPEDVLALWRRYDATGDLASRDRLVLTFAPLVKYIVYRKVREIPARCEVGDFISCGLEALIGSIDRFDPGCGTTLEQFAWTRIHGAVLDELRRQDWAPRSLRRAERDIARTREELIAVHERRPDRGELAAALGIAPEELRRREDEIAVGDVTSLNVLVGGEGDTTVERVDTLASELGELDPERAALAADAKDRFRAAFARLPRREREIAVLLYVENLTLREVGEVIGVSESRVCQLHGQLKRTLRGLLAADAALFADVA